MKKILVIDDSEFDRRMILSAMNSICDDLSCVELSNGALAAETMLSEEPKLTIVDIRMPGMSGWDVLAEIKADERIKHLKVIMMSGASSVEDIQRASANGALGFYTKPHKRAGYDLVAADIKTTYLDIAA